MEIEDLLTEKELEEYNDWLDSVNDEPTWLCGAAGRFLGEEYICDEDYDMDEGMHFVEPARHENRDVIDCDPTEFLTEEQYEEWLLAMRNIKNIEE